MPTCCFWERSPWPPCRWPRLLLRRRCARRSNDWAPPATWPPLTRGRECAKSFFTLQRHISPMMTRLANPARFMRVSGAALPWLGGATAIALAIGLVWALLLSPPDYQQGESVRIMFIHVPSAVMAEGVYYLIALA